MVNSQQSTVNSLRPACRMEANGQQLTAGKRIKELKIEN